MLEIFKEGIVDSKVIPMKRDQTLRINRLKTNREQLNPAQGCNVICYYEAGKKANLDNVFVVVADRCESSGAGMGNIGGLENFKLRKEGNRETPEQTLKREFCEEFAEVGAALEMDLSKLKHAFIANDDTNYVMKGEPFAPVDAHVFFYPLSDQEMDKLFPGALEAIQKGDLESQALERKGSKLRKDEEVHSIQVRPLRETLTADFRYAHEHVGHFSLASEMGIDLLKEATNQSITLDLDAVARPMTWHIPSEQDANEYLAERIGVEASTLTHYRKEVRTKGLAEPDKFLVDDRFKAVKVDKDLRKGKSTFPENKVSKNAQRGGSGIV